MLKNAKIVEKEKLDTSKFFLNIEAPYKVLHEVLYEVPHKALREALREALYEALHEVLHEALYKALYKVLHEALHEALHKALHKALRTEALHKALREALRTEALHWVPAIFPIASTRASAKYTPYIATLFFTLPSFLTSSLPREAPDRQPAEDRRQNQTTVLG